jgi:hypothetical protein
MRRRTVVTTGLAGILSLAGCVDQSQPSDDTNDSESGPDSQSNDDGDATGDGTGDGVEILNYEFTLNPEPENKQLKPEKSRFGAAPTIVDQTRGDTSAVVTIGGIVTGNNGCMEGQLLSAPAVDGETVTAGVGTALREEAAERREEGEPIACTHVIVQDRYELTIEYSGAPDYFEITQSGMESAGESYQLRPSWSE